MTKQPAPAPAPILAVADWLESLPSELRAILDQLRTLVFTVAHDEDAWPLIEEVKWGQPSYRSPHGNESTPVRLGYTPSGDAAVLAHCQSSVISDFRDAFGDRFRFEGDRAVLIGPGERVHEAELAELVRHALTYRRQH